MRVYLIIHSFRKCTESLLEGTRPCARGVDAMGLGPVSSSYKELTQNEQYHMKEFQNCSKLRKRKQFLTKAKFSGQGLDMGDGTARAFQAEGICEETSKRKAVGTSGRSE